MSAVANELGEGVLTPRAFANELGGGGGGLAPSAFANEPGRGDFTPSAFANELGVAQKMSPNSPPPWKKSAA
jgi:hypothetical protein